MLAAMDFGGTISEGTSQNVDSLQSLRMKLQENALSKLERPLSIFDEGTYNRDRQLKLPYPILCLPTSLLVGIDYEFYGLRRGVTIARQVRAYLRFSTSFGSISAI